MKYPKTTNDYFSVNVIKQAPTEVQEKSQFSKPLEYILTSKDLEEFEDEDLAELIVWLDNQLGCGSTRWRATRAFCLHHRWNIR